MCGILNFMIYLPESPGTWMPKESDMSLMRQSSFYPSSKESLSCILMSLIES